LLAAEGPVEATTATAKLTSDGLVPLVDAAMEIFANLGLDSTQIATLEKVRIQIADLDGARLAQARGTTIMVDVDAAGYGWFLDVTPTANEEFQTIGDDGLRALGDSAAAGHMDLLTVLLHEMGHVLGLDDHYSDSRNGQLMNGWLGAGVRRLPTEGELAALLIDSDDLDGLI
jgi:hypothetical protein